MDDNCYKYSGKEFETVRGLNRYDFHARQYDPALGLFDRPNPMAINYPGLNPYLYCAANPVMNVDPTGKDTWRINAKSEVVEWIASKEYDKFIIANLDGSDKTVIDEDGNAKTLEIQFEYGTITKVYNKHIYSFKNEDNIFTSFIIIGDDNAKNLRVYIL